MGSISLKKSIGNKPTCDDGKGLLVLADDLRGRVGALLLKFILGEVDLSSTMAIFGGVVGASRTGIAGPLDFLE